MRCRIIEPLASRCSKFRFKPLDNNSTQSRLEHIAREEHITVSPETVQALIATSGGDLRRSITYLQTASRLTNGNADTTITPRDIQEIAGVVPDEIIDDFARTLGVDPRYGPSRANKNDDDDAMMVEHTFKKPDFTSVRGKVGELIREGYSGAQLLSQVSIT